MGYEYLGSILLWPGLRIPENYMLCNGQKLSINQYPALYALIGNTYGGDGVKEFALPNLVQKFLYGCYMGSGDHTMTRGRTGGSNQVTVTSANMPLHTHGLAVTPATGTYKTCNVPGDTSTLASTTKFATGSGSTMYNSAAPDTTIASNVSPLSSNIGITGEVPGQNLNLTPSYLTLYYIICVNGIFPVQQ